MHTMQYEEALAWVHGLPRLAARPGIENTRALLKTLGNPEQGLRFVHIAGTNGKGSTTVMLASILHEAGYKTGANVSPYVLDFRERFLLDGEMIDCDTLAQLLSEVRAAAAAQESLVAFDVVTAAALLWFAREQCDIVCMEVGLGGRLDSTNAIENTLVACVTAIGMDHTELLGDTLSAIAAEKCGIFKHGCPVICYPKQPPEALAQIMACAEKAQCLLVTPDLQDFYRYRAQGFENRIHYGGYDLVVPFPGKHQAYNASVALMAALALCEVDLDAQGGVRAVVAQATGASGGCTGEQGCADARATQGTQAIGACEPQGRTRSFDISDEAILNGIANARFPARIEVLRRSPLVLLDGAHNADGARALAATLRAAGQSNLVGVMGVLEGKQPEEMLRALCPHFAALYCVSPASPRALRAEALAALAQAFCEVDEKNTMPITACASVAQALVLAQERAAQTGAGLVVCGSLYLAAEARQQLI